MYISDVNYFPEKIKVFSFHLMKCVVNSSTDTFLYLAYVPNILIM